jgi:O-antigen/teichoic acid export membrane protein
VTEYDLVYKLFALTSIITSSINSSLWSAYTDAFFRNDTEWIKAIIRKLNASTPFVCIMLVLMIICSEKIIYIWSGGLVKTSISFLILFGIYSLINYWNSIYSNVLNGISKIRLGVFTTTITASLNLFLSISMAKSMGLEGVILATIITSLLSAVLSPVQVYYWIFSKKHNKLLDYILS